MTNTACLTWFLRILATLRVYCIICCSLSFSINYFNSLWYSLPGSGLELDSRTSSTETGNWAANKIRFVLTSIYNSHMTSSYTGWCCMSWEVFTIRAVEWPSLPSLRIGAFHIDWVLRGLGKIRQRVLLILHHFTLRASGGHGGVTPLLNHLSPAARH